MKEIHRKTVDDAVNQMLIKAYRQGVRLSWDRAEQQQPQCGFERLCLCCKDCFEGPCRINPFGEDGQKTVCGRTKEDLIESAVIADMTDGQQALSRILSARGYEVTLAISARDDMIGYAMEDALPALGESSALLLQSLAKEQPGTIEAGLGALAADKANIVLYGHFDPDMIEQLQDPEVALSGICGAEGTPGVNSLTVYDSQETPLLTNAVDAIVIGVQCVMPAVLDLAEAQGIPVYHRGDDAQQILQGAKAAFAHRGKKTVDIPENAVTVKVSGVAEAKAVAEKAPKGAVYIGGCGHLSHTQGGDIVKTAKALIDDGFAVISAGCLGVTLAKAGLPEDRFAYLGACTNAGLFLQIGGAAVFTEIVHSKILATAAAFAGAGIQVHLEKPAYFAQAEIAENLKQLNILPFGNE